MSDVENPGTIVWCHGMVKFHVVESIEVMKNRFVEHWDNADDDDGSTWWMTVHRFGNLNPIEIALPTVTAFVSR